MEVFESPLSVLFAGGKSPPDPPAWEVVQEAGKVHPEAERANGRLRRLFTRTGGTECSAEWLYPVSA